MAEGFLRDEGCGGHPGPAMGPGHPSWPRPPKPGAPPPCPPGESGLDCLFFDAAGASNAFGVGEVGMGGRRGGRPPGQGHAGGWGVRGWWGWQPELPRRKWRETPPPPPEKGPKMFELAQLNLFTFQKKEGGGRPLAIHHHVLAGDGTWVGWSLRGGPGPERRPGPR